MTVNEVVRRFQAGPLHSDLFSVPGIGTAAHDKLKLAFIDTADQLVGQYFLHNRNRDSFEEYLEDLGLQPRWAKICAHNIHQRFGSM